MPASPLSTHYHHHPPPPTGPAAGTHLLLLPGVAPAIFPKHAAVTAITTTASSEWEGGEVCLEPHPTRLARTQVITAGGRRNLEPTFEESAGWLLERRAFVLLRPHRTTGSRSPYSLTQFLTDLMVFHKHLEILRGPQRSMLMQHSPLDWCVQFLAPKPGPCCVHCSFQCIPVCWCHSLDQSGHSLCVLLRGR